MSEKDMLEAITKLLSSTENRVEEANKVIELRNKHDLDPRQAFVKVVSAKIEMLAAKNISMLQKLNDTQFEKQKDLLDLKRVLPLDYSKEETKEKLDEKTIALIDKIHEKYGIGIQDCLDIDHQLDIISFEQRQTFHKLESAASTRKMLSEIGQKAVDTYTRFTDRQIVN